MGRFVIMLSTTLATACTALVTGAVVLGASGAASAAEPRPPVLARVSVSDLDLARPDDARLFQARVEAAGETVCQARQRAQRLDRFSVRACRLEVRDEVLSKLSRRQTRALHASGG